VLAVFWYFYSRWYPIYITLAVIGAFMLMAGARHLLSDILSGDLFGVCRPFNHTVVARDGSPLSLWRSRVEPGP